MKRSLTDGKISLRPLRLSDADGLRSAVWNSALELKRWMRWISPRPTRRECTAWIRMAQKSWRAHLAFNFGIFDTRDGQLLGSVWLSKIDGKHCYANVGYWVRSDHSKRGIATAAVRLIIPFGFKDAGMNRLEILASVENKASQRVAAKVGARREGVLRQRLRLENRYHDAVMFSLLKAGRRA